MVKVFLVVGTSNEVSGLTSVIIFLHVKGRVLLI